MELLAGRCAIRDGGLDLAREELLELARGVDAIVADPAVAVDEALLEAAGPQLRVVANFAVGYDNVDIGACRRRGVAVTNTPDVLTNATAELALALALAAARRFTEAEADLRGWRWRGWDPGAYLGLELTGATFGVVGMGRIGRRYAELVVGFAGEVLFASRTPKEDAERELGVRRVALEEIFRRADVVSLHLPATAETTGLVGPRELAAM
jgi:glyoxylate reductase